MTLTFRPFQFWFFFEKVHVYTCWLKSICKIRYFQIFPKKSANNKITFFYFIGLNIHVLRGFPCNQERIYFYKKLEGFSQAVSGQFPDGHFPDGHFPEDSSPTDISPTDISPTDISPNGHFPERTFPRRTFPRLTFPRTDISPNGHFPDRRTFPRPTDISPTGFFCLVLSVTQLTQLLKHSIWEERSDER